MFGFMDMLGNYESRKVDRFNSDELFISTVMVSDGKDLYETAVRHQFYNNNKMVIVESYATKIMAKKGHKKWLEKMTLDKLPDYLEDCGNSEIARIAEAAGCMTKFFKKENK